MRKNLKFNRFLLLGVVFTSPIVVFANTKPESSSRITTETSNQNFEQVQDTKYLKYLLREGAISTKEADNFIKNKSSEISPEINLPTNKVTPRNEITNPKEIKNIKLQLDETENYIKLNLVNITKEWVAIFTKVQLIVTI